MCLSIPGKVLERFSDGEIQMGKVGFGTIVKDVCLEHVPDARPGDFVLVHVGFALQKIDEREAELVFEYLRAIGTQEEDLEAIS
jgi:hydrogenase expression/formation protein HypC